MSEIKLKGVTDDDHVAKFQEKLRCSVADALLLLKVAKEVSDEKHVPVEQAVDLVIKVVKDDDNKVPD